MLKLIPPALLLFLFSSCVYYKPVKVDFKSEQIPSPPDYSNDDFWCALPEKKDSADHIPSVSEILLIDGQATAQADVFYIYPTQFFSRTEWNASLDDEKLNELISSRAVTNQATVFNGSCRVYIPKYRQATYNAYFSLSNPDAKKAFELAYEDVKNAFQYYLDHYNNGRPIIIAGHSQGTTHAKWLLRDFFDGKPLQKQLICAYLIGMPVYTNEFSQIMPCDSASQTGCFISWRSYLEGNEPKRKFMVENPENIIVTNPLSFTRTAEEIDSTNNLGALDRDGETIIPHACSAVIHNDIIWVSRPDVQGNKLIPKNLHPADYNLYWLSIRENIRQRVEAFNIVHN